MRAVYASFVVFGFVLGACGPGQDLFTETQGAIQSFVEVPGEIRLEVLDWGGTGDLLLFIPGVTGTAHIFNGIAREFTDSYRVVAMTRRGHGASGKPGSPFDLDVLADDIAVVIDRFADGPAILVGHSYGGVELPRLASRHPSKVQALIFLDAVYDWPDLLQWPGQPGYAMPDSAYPSLEELEAWYRLAFPEFRSPVALEHLRSQVRVTEQNDLVWQLPFPGPEFLEFANLYAGWSGTEFSGIQVPVLSIQADQEEFLEVHLAGRGFPEDSIEAVGRWAQEYDNVGKGAGRAMLLDAVPHAVTMVLDSTHHILQLQRPDEVVRLMREFLKDHVGGPDGGGR